MTIGGCDDEPDGFDCKRQAAQRLCGEQRRWLKLEGEKLMYYVCEVGRGSWREDDEEEI
jgi:hypothetical protein